MKGQTALEIREDKALGVFVRGLQEIVVDTKAETFYSSLRYVPCTPYTPYTPATFYSSLRYLPCFLFPLPSFS